MELKKGLQTVVAVDYQETYYDNKHAYPDVQYVDVNVVWLHDQDDKKYRMPVMIFEKDGEYGACYLNDTYAEDGAWKVLAECSMGMTFGEIFEMEEAGPCPAKFRNEYPEIEITDIDDNSRPVIVSEEIYNKWKEQGWIEED